MARLHPVVALLALSLLWPAWAAAQADAPAKRLRFVSPTPGQEVLFRIHVSPSAGERAERIELVGSSRAVQAGGEIHVRTPVEIRLAPTEAFRATFSTVAPGTTLRMLLPGTAERQVSATGEELVLVRRAEGGPVELEAAAAIEVSGLPGQLR